MAFVLAGGFKATNGSTRRSARVCASVSREVREAPLTLHTTDDTSIKILYPVAEGRVLIDAVNRLVTSFQTIKESAKRGERAREESLDYSLKNDNIKLEFHCNPNLFPDPIHAKVCWLGRPFFFAVEIVRGLICLCISLISLLAGLYHG